MRTRYNADAPAASTSANSSNPNTNASSASSASNHSGEKDKEDGTNDEEGPKLSRSNSYENVLAQEKEGDEVKATRVFNERPFCTYQGHTSEVLDICWSKVRKLLLFQLLTV